MWILSWGLLQNSALMHHWKTFIWAHISQRVCSASKRAKTLLLLVMSSTPHRMMPQEQKEKLWLRTPLKASSWKYFLLVENITAWLVWFSFPDIKKLSCPCIISPFKNLKKTKKNMIWYNMHPMKRQVWCQDKLHKPQPLKRAHLMAHTFTQILFLLICVCLGRKKFLSILVTTKSLTEIQALDFDICAHSMMSLRSTFPEVATVWDPPSTCAASAPLLPSSRCLSTPGSPRSAPSLHIFLYFH